MRMQFQGEVMSRNRSRVPLLIEVMKSGKLQKTLGCPYCKPTHELPTIGQTARCGTYVQIQAIQSLYFERNIVCMVCGKGGGTFIKVGDKEYNHTHDCMPGKKMLQKQPKFNPLAKVIFSLPKSVQQALNKTTGIISMQVTDKEGKVMGYSFDKP
jgi:hypothetical protein